MYLNLEKFDGGAGSNARIRTPDQLRRPDYFWPDTEYSYIIPADSYAPPAEVHLIWKSESGHALFVPNLALFSIERQIG